MAKEFGIIYAVQIFSLAFSAAIVLLLAVIYDAAHRSLSWYSNPWLLFGIYMCPLFFGLGFGPAIYFLVYNKRVSNKLLQNKDIDDIAILKRGYQVQLFLHAHCLILIGVVLIMTIMGVRSAFLIMIGLIFYGLSMFISLFSKMQLRGKRERTLPCQMDE